MKRLNSAAWISTWRAVKLTVRAQRMHKFSGEVAAGVQLAARLERFIPREKSNMEEEIHKSALTQHSDPVYYRLRFKSQSDSYT
jgi:hypothetical protein